MAAKTKNSFKKLSSPWESFAFFSLGVIQYFPITEERRETIEAWTLGSIGLAKGVIEIYFKRLNISDAVLEKAEPAVQSVGHIATVSELSPAPASSIELPVAA